MKNLYRKEAHPGVCNRAFALLLGVVVMFTAGCNPDGSDGDIIAELLLPTDTDLRLHCLDVGVFEETCIEQDPENPYQQVGFTEFNNETGEDANKFEFANAIPPGTTGAKARFYFWATALARASYEGANQWFTAQALHEVWTAQPIKNPLVREQALRAYQSVLKNYYGSVTFFSEVPPSSRLLRQLLGFILICPDATYADLFTGLPGDPTALSTISEWGFTYIPPPAGCLGNFDEGQVEISTFDAVTTTPVGDAP